MSFLIIILWISGVYQHPVFTVHTVSLIIIIIIIIIIIFILVITFMQGIYNYSRVSCYDGVTFSNIWW